MLILKSYNRFMWRNNSLSCYSLTKMKMNACQQVASENWRIQIVFMWLQMTTDCLWLLYDTTLWCFLSFDSFGAWPLWTLQYEWKRAAWRMIKKMCCFRRHRKKKNSHKQNFWMTLKSVNDRIKILGKILILLDGLRQSWIKECSSQN